MQYHDTTEDMREVEVMQFRNMSVHVGYENIGWRGGLGTSPSCKARLNRGKGFDGERDVWKEIKTLFLYFALPLYI